MTNTLTNDPASALPSRGWLATFAFLGVVMALDGLLSLAAGEAATAAMVEAAGKALGGSLVAAYGALGLRGARPLEGKGIEGLAIIALCLYAGGKVVGSAWWTSVVG